MSGNESPQKRQHRARLAIAKRGPLTGIRATSHQRPAVASAARSATLRELGGLRGDGLVKGRRERRRQGGTRGSDARLDVHRQTSRAFRVLPTFSRVREIRYLAVELCDVVAPSLDFLHELVDLVLDAGDLVPDLVLVAKGILDDVVRLHADGVARRFDDAADVFRML